MNDSITMNRNHHVWEKSNDILQKENGRRKYDESDK
jgi:hypothetical protein